jgi:hypothetical protein
MTSGRSSEWAGILGAAACLAASACIGATEPLDVVTWEAGLIGADGAADPPSGSVAMVIGENQPRAGIGVRDAPARATLAWDVRAGTCAAPGDRVGPATAWPAIQVSDSGTGAAEATVNRRIDTDGPYAGFLYEGELGSGGVLACADLERQP